MIKAKSKAAQRGFEFYVHSDPRPNRARINEQLAEAGLPAVSERMYDHFGRLARKGCTTYMPINEFDLAVKLGHLRTAS